MNISLHMKKENFDEYMSANSKDEHLEYTEVKKYTDEILKDDLQK